MKDEELMGSRIHLPLLWKQDGDFGSIGAMLLDTYIC